MDFLFVFIATAVVLYACKPLIKRFPAALYLLSAALVLLFLATPHVSFPGVVERLLFFLIHKGTLALSMFCIVMFIGALPHRTRLRQHLAAIRTELSISACILVAGHMVLYLASYLSRMGAHPMSPMVAAALAVAALLLVLTLVLGVTSIDRVKQRMSARSWSTLHKLAYLFFALTFLHLTLMLLPSALAGVGGSIAKLAVYLLVFTAYATLRLREAANGKASPYADDQAAGPQTSAR